MARLIFLLLAVVLVVAAGGPTALLGGGDDAPPGADRARVLRVVDGDTLRVRRGGREESVRLIGIDTPESVKPGAAVECGASAATRTLKRRALTAEGEGRRVRLVFDRTQDRRDRYGRLLAYAELADGTDLGREQVREGLAATYVYGGDAFQRLRGYRAAERRAEDEGRGVHRLCGGDFHRSQ